MTISRPTIGVFDSGFGGLTVLRALLPLIPDADYIYLGDTARLPYGSKSQQTIARYAVESAHFLVSKGAEMLVIACNTATALALPEIIAAVPVPVVGVIEPGAKAALAASPLHPSLQSEGTAAAPRVLVLATAATVQSAAYTHALHKLGLEATEKACPLLVPLVEEGWIDHTVTAQVLKIYLTEALAEAPHTSTLVLGCTHYPLLKPLIEQLLIELDQSIRIVDAAQATALAAAALLTNAAETGTPTCTFYATDSIEKFQRLGPHFLGQPLPQVNLLDLGG